MYDIIRGMTTIVFEGYIMWKEVVLRSAYPASSSEIRLMARILLGIRRRRMSPKLAEAQNRAETHQGADGKVNYCAPRMSRGKKEFDIIATSQASATCGWRLTSTW